MLSSKTLSAIFSSFVLIVLGLVNTGITSAQVSQLVNGDLVVTGTAFNDTIRIQSVYPHVGIHRVTWNGTSIFFKDINNIYVDTGDGDDQFDFVGGVALSDMFVLMGEGNDDIWFRSYIQNGFSSCRVEGTLKVDMGNGNNNSQLENLIVENDFEFTSGNGLDRVRMNFGQIEGSFSMDTGASRDWVFMRVPLIERNARLDTGAGNDIVSFEVPPNFRDDCEISLGSGNDLLFGSVSALGDFDLKSGQGEDRIVLEYGSFAGSANFETGTHDDTIILNNTTCSGSTCRINTGSGHDWVELDDSEFDPLVDVSLGSGNDHIFFIDCELRKQILSLRVRGGFGSDSAEDDNSTFFGPTTLPSVENIAGPF